MKPTDKQLREIGKAATEAFMGHGPSDQTRQDLVVAGRAAFIASAKLCLRLPTLGECDDAARGGPSDMSRCSRLFANRLRSLTDPEDKAVEAVLNSGYIVKFDTETARQIVAAVREADKR